MPDPRDAAAQELLALLLPQERVILGVDELDLELVGMRRVAPQRIGRDQGPDPLPVVGVDEHALLHGVTPMVGSRLLSTDARGGRRIVHLVIAEHGRQAGLHQSIDPRQLLVVEIVAIAADLGAPDLVGVRVAPILRPHADAAAAKEPACARARAGCRRRRTAPPRRSAASSGCMPRKATIRRRLAAGSACMSS